MVSIGKEKIKCVRGVKRLLHAVKRGGTNGAIQRELLQGIIPIVRSAAQARRIRSARRALGATEESEDSGSLPLSKPVRAMSKRPLCKTSLAEPPSNIVTV